MAEPTVTAAAPLGHEGSAAADGTSHIFIVGASRSGTTLMRRILERSDEVAISSENHFLGHLLEREGVRHHLRRFGDLRDDANVRRLVAYVYSDAFMSQSRLRTPSRHWRYVRNNVPASELEARILGSDRTERCIFDAILDSYADDKGKRIRGEKTPAHVRYVPTLLRWYPRGVVIHMLRDPRAVYVSEVNRRGQDHAAIPYRYLVRLPLALKLFAAVQTALAWYESVRLAERYSRLFGRRYVTVRFEDLVADPETVLRGLCQAIGIRYDPAMLDQRVVSRGFAIGRSGFDPTAAERWRAMIEPWVATPYRLLFGRRLQALGYRR